MPEYLKWNRNAEWQQAGWAIGPRAQKRRVNKRKQGHRVRGPCLWPAAWRQRPVWDGPPAEEAQGVTAAGRQATAHKADTQRGTRARIQPPQRGQRQSLQLSSGSAVGQTSLQSRSRNRQSQTWVWNRGLGRWACGRKGETWGELSETGETQKETAPQHEHAEAWSWNFETNQSLAYYGQEKLNWKKTF